MAIDVTVRGAGVFGLACAWAMARRGARVRVVDPEGVARGASGGVVGALAPHVPETWNDKKAFQLDSLLMAEDWWTAVAEIGGGDPGYARTGRLQPIPDDAALTRAEERAERAATLWPDSVTWQVVPVPEGWAPPSPTGRVIHDTLSARLHPAKACAALAAALRVLGAEIIPDGPDAGPVVHATGWRGLTEMEDARGRPAGTGVKGQAALLAFDRRDAPQLYVDGLHIVPHSDGTTAIGSTSERDFDAPHTTDGRLDDVLARVRVAIPALADAPVLARWAGVRPRARSRAPLMGPWPRRPGHFIANGGFKIGFGMAPKVAETMAALVLGGEDAIPAAFHSAALAPAPAPD